MDSLVDRMEPKGSLANVSRFYCATNMLSESEEREPPVTPATVAIACWTAALALEEDPTLRETQSLRAKAYFPDALLIARRLRQRPVQLRSTGLDPACPGARLAEGRIKIGYDDGVSHRVGLDQHSTVRVKDHGIASSNLVIVVANAVAEEQEHTVVVRS